MILPVLLTEGVNRGRLTMSDVVRLTSYNAARLFGLYPKKGALEAGSVAALVILYTHIAVQGALPPHHSAGGFRPVARLRVQGSAATSLDQHHTVITTRESVS